MKYFTYAQIINMQNDRMVYQFLKKISRVFVTSVIAVFVD